MMDFFKDNHYQVPYFLKAVKIRQRIVLVDIFKQEIKHLSVLESEIHNYYYVALG